MMNDITNINPAGDMSIDGKISGYDLGANLTQYEAPSASAVRRVGRDGFTLVELLTVVGITGILIGVLLPAIGAARGTARTTYGLTNQRGIVTAINTYAADNDDAPPETAPWATNPGAISSQLQSLSDGIHGLGSLVDQDYATLGSFADLDATFYDLNHVESGWEMPLTAVSSSYSYRGRDKALDLAVSGVTGDERFAPNLSQLPLGTVLTLDFNAQKPINRFNNHHGSMVNLVYFDGAGKTVKDVDFYWSSGEPFSSSTERSKSAFRTADKLE